LPVPPPRAQPPHLVPTLSGYLSLCLFGIRSHFLASSRYFCIVLNIFASLPSLGSQARQNPRPVLNLVSLLSSHRASRLFLVASFVHAFAAVKYSLCGPPPGSIPHPLPTVDLLNVRQIVRSLLWFRPSIYLGKTRRPVHRPMRGVLPKNEALTNGLALFSGQLFYDGRTACCVGLAPPGVRLFPRRPWPIWGFLVHSATL